MRSMHYLIAAGLLAALPVTAAHAEWYVGAGGGISFTTDADGLKAGKQYDTQFDPGAVALGRIGYKSGLFRYEGEVSWRGQDLESMGGLDADGELNSTALMGNLLMDIPLNSPITPYVGFGIGTAYVDTDGHLSGNPSMSYDGTDWVFAYQVMFGASYALDNNWALNGEYRMFNTTQYDATTDTGAKFDAPIHNHSFLVGFTYHFNEAKPAPQPAPQPVATPAAPPPPPPSNFLVFFDWNAAAITPQAENIIAQAAAATKKGKKAHIDLTGHTDRSGPDAYNMKLSMARAEAVRNELARMGVDADIISVSAKGEGDPLVQTADGIREPQNRRVEIYIP